MGGDGNGRGGWKASINEWEVESEGLQVVKEKCRVEWIREWNGEEAWILAKGRGGILPNKTGWICLCTVYFPGAEDCQWSRVVNLSTHMTA